LIQNAFISIGQDEPYAISSPEYTIMASIGYDRFVPEPETGAMMLLGFTGLPMRATGGVGRMLALSLLMRRSRFNVEAGAV
jgi:hypothetical protein